MKHRRAIRFNPSVARTLAAFVLVFGAAMLVVAVLMPTDRLMARFNPDGTYNEGFIEWEDLRKTWWSSLDQTSYENGEATSTARIVKTTPDGYSVTRTDAQGNRTTLVGETAQGGSQVDYLVDPSASPLSTMLGAGAQQGRHGGGSFSLDVDGRVTKVEREEGDTLTIGPPSDIYYTDGQTLYHDGTLVAHREYTGTLATPLLGLRPAKADDYDAAGSLISSTEYAYNG